MSQFPVQFLSKILEIIVLPFVQFNVSYLSPSITLPFIKCNAITLHSFICSPLEVVYLHMCRNKIFQKVALSMYIYPGANFYARPL